MKPHLPKNAHHLVKISPKFSVSLYHLTCHVYQYKYQNSVTPAVPSRSSTWCVNSTFRCVTHSRYRPTWQTYNKTLHTSFSDQDVTTYMSCFSWMLIYIHTERGHTHILAYTETLVYVSIKAYTYVRFNTYIQQRIMQTRTQKKKFTPNKHPYTKHTHDEKRTQAERERKTNK